VIGMWSVGCLRMNDDRADQADHFLHGAVRVVEECAFLMDGEFVSERTAGRNRFLADPGNTVLVDGRGRLD
jgi:hypothetical protein